MVIFEITEDCLEALQPQTMNADELMQDYHQAVESGGVGKLSKTNNIASLIFEKVLAGEIVVLMKKNEDDPHA